MMHFSENHSGGDPMSPRKLTQQELASRPLTERDVNRCLQAMGINERLVRSHGYFYFAVGNAFRWPSQGVYVYHCSEFTIQQWLDAYKKLAVVAAPATLATGLDDSKEDR